MGNLPLTPAIAGAESSIRRMAAVEILIVPTFSRDTSLPRDRLSDLGQRRVINAVIIRGGVSSTAGKIEKKVCQGGQRGFKYLEDVKLPV